MTGNAIIEIRDVSFSYYKHRNILENITAEINPRCLTVILGKNGSGKSTLIRIMAGMQAISSGSVKINGMELSQISLINRSRLFSFLPQSHKAVFSFKVIDVVLTGRSPYSGFFPGKKDIDKAVNTLEDLKIEHLKDRLYTELSGGEQQLIMIARMITQETRIIFMDEPISHLDFNNQIRIIKLLKKMVNEGYTIIISIHDPNFAFLSGDEFLLINDGKIMKTDRYRPWENNEINEIFNKDIKKIDFRNKQLFIPDL